jgi:ribA/ribD-fused uncharacterized protein
MISEFKGEHRYLSSFWPVRVEYDGAIYPSVEHAYQAAKTLDPDERLSIRYARTPGQAKRLGQEVTLRPDWEEMKVFIMLGLLKQKFAPGSELAEKLKATLPETLIEGNHWHDNFWGRCNCSRCEGVPAENNLGMCLMEVRRNL